MRTRPLVILGTGRIGRALLRQLLQRAEHVRERYDLALPVAALANSRYLCHGAPYLPAERVAGVVEEGLHDGEPAPAERARQLIDYIRDLAGSDEPAIVVDVTAADGMAPLLLAALDAGCDVALANKKPLAGDYATFVGLTQHLRGRLAYEATAGAGLPIIHALRNLVDAGDRLIDLTACLSGTLGYLCTELEDGRPLSSIVPEARDLGYTEPDPREDLSGADVRRKALILARTMGMPLEPADVPGTPLIPLDEGSVEEWLRGLSRYDAVLAQRVAAAHEQGDVLRYVARILPDKCEVGLREVPRSSAVGRLRGSDNIMTARTHFYDDRPLVIAGPGAGPDVTAAGIVGDLLRLAGAA